MPKRNISTAPSYEYLYGDDCVYCGEPANTVDHVLPLNYTKAVALTDAERELLYIVPACTECNCALGARVFDSFQERAGYVAARLAKKNRALLAQEPWSPEEIKELGPSLRSQVARLQEERERAIARTMFAARQSLGEGRPIQVR